MKVYLLDRDNKTVDMWKLYFGEYREVVPVCDDFAHFIDSTEIECVVSPANSYGLMDGGYDLAISKYFGWELQEKVQQYILDYYYGEQPVGTSLIHDKDWDINSKCTKWRIKYNDKRVTVKSISALREIRVINARTGNTLSCTISSNNIDADSRHDIIDTVADYIKNV